MMNQQPQKILILQTAFLGDVILTTPVPRVLKKHYPDAQIHFVTTPIAAELLQNNPSIDIIIPYDKRGSQKGLSGMLALSSQLRKDSYDLAIVPHRSFRSGSLIALSRIKRTISFSTSSAAFAFSDIVVYRKEIHEIERNLSLLAPLGIALSKKELPDLYPGEQEKSHIERFFMHNTESEYAVAIAPGSVWNTKRWLPERFAEVGRSLVKKNITLFLIGGKGDSEVGNMIHKAIQSPLCINTIGTLSLLESAELIRRCNVLLTNDSAPLHIGTAMRTPVIAIFGATVPSFGFGPIGDHDDIMQDTELGCRPCAIHGGHQCPIGTFDCMNNITAEQVAEKIISRLQRSQTKNQ